MEPLEVPHQQLPQIPRAFTGFNPFQAPAIRNDGEIFTILWPHVPSMLGALERVLENVALLRPTSPEILLLHELCGTSRQQRAEKEVRSGEILRMDGGQFESAVASERMLIRHDLGRFGKLELEELRVIRSIQNRTEVPWRLRYIDVSSDDPSYEVVRSEEEAVQTFLSQWRAPKRPIHPVEPLEHLIEGLERMILERGKLITVRDAIMKEQVRELRKETDPTTPIVVLVGSAHSAVHDSARSATYVARVEEVVFGGPREFECEMTQLQDRAARNEPITRRDLEQALLFMALDAAIPQFAPFSGDAPPSPLRHSMSSMLLQKVSSQDRTEFMRSFDAALRAEPAGGRTVEALALDAILSGFGSLREFLKSFPSLQELLSHLELPSADALC